MTRRVLGTALVMALVTLGCQTAITHSPTTDEQSREMRYSLLSLSGVTVVASSTENSFFAASKVVDGVLNSAWAPLFSDPSPTLTFDLGATKVLDSLAIKLSPGGTQVAVAIWTGSAWETIATGFTPAEATLASLNLPDRTTTKVRLTFSGTPAADLLVCEVKFEGTDPTPRPPCDCKVTGGGWVYKLGPNNSKVTFGLVAMDDKSGGAKGVIEVNDHTTHKKYHGKVDRIVCDNNNMTVTFSGTLRNGNAFTAVVTDIDEPGKDDAFSFTTAGFSISGLLGDDDFGGGNIQVHRDNCP